MEPAKTSPPVDWLIIDGAYLCWRSFCSTPPTFRSPTGESTSTLHGFIGGVRSARKDTRASKVIIAWEGGSPHRDAIFSSYKAERRTMPDDLASSFQLVQRIAPMLGWPVIQVIGLEADDVIFSLKSQLTGTCAVFTTDKDIISLMSPEFRIYQRAKGKGGYLTEDEIKQKWGVAPSQIPDVLAIAGDQVDGIPGVKGIGMKTAIKLVSHFGNIETILEKAGKPELEPPLTPKIAGLITGSDSMQRSHDAIKLVSRPLDLDSLTYSVSTEAARELEQLGIKQLKE